MPGIADTERLRVQAATGLQRVDAPGGHLSVITDRRAGRMVVLDHDRRGYAVLPLARGGDDRAGTPRRGETVVIAGIGCTDWAFGPPAADRAIACLDAGGDTLRIASGGRVLAEAIRVEHAPQDASWFAPPAGYARLPPDGSGGGAR